MSAFLLKGKPCADAVYGKISERLFGKTLCTVGFDNSQWIQYTDSLSKSAQKLGVNCRSVTVANDISPQEFCEIVVRASNDAQIDGILIQQPLPQRYRVALGRIDPKKDVDCCNPLSVANLYAGESKVCPATPSAVVKDRKRHV